MIGAVAGLVVITPAAGFVTPRGAMIMGVIGALVCFWSCHTVNKCLHVDDSLDAFGLHGVGGFVGAVITGAFAVDGGLFYGGGFELLGKQLLGALAGAVYSAAATAILFGALSAVMRVRVAEEEELQGIDERSHGEVAYARTPCSTMRSQGTIRFRDEDGPSLTSSSGATPGTASEAAHEEQSKQPEEHPRQQELVAV